MFPGVSIQDIKFQEFEDNLKLVIKEMNLENIESQFKKCIQFYESCIQRIGVAIVGPSGCGKSTIWKMTKKALEKSGNKILT